MKLNHNEMLWNLCEQFIEENRITCGETIYQSDHVVENAYDFIDEICKLVGYAKIEEE